MKVFKFTLRIWITISSILIFLTSWMIFGHSPKPVSLNSSPNVQYTTLPTLEPLPGMSSSASGSNNLIFVPSQNIRRSPPVFITGGS
jgi:hypothetical protein